MMRKTYIQYRGSIEEFHFFDDPTFTVDGKKFTIVSTESYGKGSMDTRHHVRGEKETKVLEHRTLVKLYNENRLQ